MLRGISTLFVAAVAGMAVPAGAEAASVVLTYDTIQTFTGPNATGTSTTIAAGTTAITIPPGGSLRYNVRATVVGDAGPVSTAYTDVARPALLGLGAFGAYITNSNPALLPPRTGSGSFSTALVNSLFASVSSQGTVANGAIGDPASPASFIAGGTNSAAVSAADEGSIPRFTIGASTVASQNLLFRQIGFNFIYPPGGSATLTTVLPTSSMAFVTVASVGNAGTAPTYVNRNFNPLTDTLTGLPPLFVTLVPEPAGVVAFGVVGVGWMARRRRAITAFGRRVAG